MKIVSTCGDYDSNRAWSDKYIPSIAAIVGPHLITPAPFERDVKEATDLIVLKARDMTIAARVRRPGYVDRYPWQFTIRSRTKWGAKTEITKIIDGWADWMFYGHAAPTGADLACWYLIDLAAFRAALIRDAMREVKRISLAEVPNGDGTSFVPFDLRMFTPSILIATSHPVPVAA